MEICDIVSDVLRVGVSTGTARPYLRTTGLIHEVYVRLFGSNNADWQGRAHFFAALGREMRQSSSTTRARVTRRSVPTDAPNSH